MMYTLVKKNAILIHDGLQYQRAAHVFHLIIKQFCELGPIKHNSLLLHYMVNHAEAY